MAAFEAGVGFVVETDIVPERQIGDQADQRFSAVPDVLGNPAKDTRQGVEHPVTGFHFTENGVQ